MVTWEQVLSHSTFFLIGVLTGAGGQYLADKFTDQRRRQEATAAVDAEWAKFEKAFPDVLNAIQQALRSNPLMREIVVARARGMVINSIEPQLRFDEPDYEGIRVKLRMLEEAGYLDDISTNSMVLMMRMTTEFVERVQRR